MIVERIVSKDDEKAAVFFDNGEKLVLHKDVLYQSGLRKGDEISLDHFSTLNRQETFYLIKQKAFRLLQRRIHTSRELYTKLRQKFSDDLLIKNCLTELQQKGFINDREFAFAFILEKQKSKKWSKAKLKSELIKRGVSKEIISEVLNQTFDTEKEIESAKELAEKKLLQIIKKENDKRKIFQKIMMYLQSKGYDYEMSSEVVRKILKSDDAD
ncbi:MAG: regulatory protein RecX [Ignavibacterium sp.]|uniref:regulatory protein RecX n=1 Tax=Ignavibacterium sp. TaxID=2651167 RepID=UPI00404B368E